MKRVMRKPPKEGRYPDDVYGALQVNAGTGKARITWFFWTQQWDREEKESGPYGWFAYDMSIFSRQVGYSQSGPRLYTEEHFKSVPKAVRRHHKVMAHADNVAYRKAEHVRAEREDWVTM